MKYKLFTTRTFGKKLKLCQKRGYPIEKLRVALKLLIENGSLPQNYKPHRLHGNHEGEWEAHIEPNWLLIWEQNDDELTLLPVINRNTFRFVRLEKTISNTYLEYSVL